MGKQLLKNYKFCGFAKYGRRLDLSQGAFARIAPLSQGICKVKIERL